MTAPPQRLLAFEGNPMFCETPTSAPRVREATCRACGTARFLQAPLAERYLAGLRASARAALERALGAALLVPKYCPPCERKDLAFLERTVTGGYAPPPPDDYTREAYR